MRNRRLLDDKTPTRPTLARALPAALSLPAALFVLGLGACSAFETNLQDTEVSYQTTARQNFESGDEAFKAERFSEAIKFFEHVKNKFPYSKYAVLADLRIADAHFEREKWLEAADAYRLFVRFHPRHEEVPYATWRIALSYYKEMKKGFFLLPPAHETDLASTHDAIRAFDEYVSRYPDGEHVEEAKRLRTEARTRLAEHDMYAAEFYVKREKWQGALWRYERVANEFADTPKAAEALLEAGSICEEHLERPDAAKAHYERLVRDFPEAPQAQQARQRMKELAGAGEAPAEPKKASLGG